ncbi:probable E3 ubiquitin-protein ligase HIP1 [Ananas comosus]|uniref:RING-type E3 ubiquitin transferase n=1 Tax=Ananas comosus TaxID=4615 RepID=A0A199V242_ANACO|nr:probable E3 ubiquitin-protein ligase HIP1 [Ananas comosus]XP_020109390.1 probable E3 ubiquitin-protein ligase HIP1 [Ananas comosus]OAY71147.1 putative E3 ubiquitin-protein ligase HIP1 [Ananas comosus]
MQGQKNNLHSCSETYQFDLGSNSNASGMDHRNLPPLSAMDAQNLPGEQRSASRQSEANNGPSLESVNLNLNINQIDHGQSVHNTGNVGGSVQELESGPSPLPYNTGLLPPEHLYLAGASSDNFGSSSRGHRSSNKRKNIGGVPGQPSLCQSSSYHHPNEDRLLSPASFCNSANTTNTSGSSNNNTTSPHPRVVQTTPVASNYHSGSAESFVRSMRMRIDPHQYDIPLPDLYPPRSSSSHSNQWSLHQPSYTTIHQSEESRLSVNNVSSHGHPLIIPEASRDMHPCPPNGTSDSRIGSSSSSMRNISEHLMFVPPTNNNHLAQGSTNWHSTSENRVMHGSASSSAAIQPAEPQVITRRSPSTYNHRSASETAHAPPRSWSAPPQRDVHFVTSREFGSRLSGTGLRAHQQPYLRSAASTDRQNDGLLGVPLFMRTLAVAREGRSRMLSEIRNMLDLLRRGENMRLEDVLIFDQSMFFGGPDMHDRHRDMRLDVDNMSYEELLALEERIGNVNTGLSEEKIIKCLKRRKYFSISSETLEEIEPCCVCQEEYVEGEDLGRLDCGHDFHTACIKQWLMLKNLCPVCKATGLAT